MKRMIDTSEEGGVPVPDAANPPATPGLPLVPAFAPVPTPPPEEPKTPPGGGKSV